MIIEKWEKIDLSILSIISLFILIITFFLTNYHKELWLRAIYVLFSAISILILSHFTIGSIDRKLWLFAYGYSLSISAILFALAKKDYLSVTFIWVLIGSIILLFLLFNPWKEKLLNEIFGNFSKLDLETIKSYYTKFFELLGLLFTVFVLGLSILWGIKAGAYSNMDFNLLHVQTLILTFFLVYMLLVLVTTIGQDLKKQIEDKSEKEKIEKTDKKMDDDAMKILRQRYVKGEITKEEYEEMKKALKDE